MLVTYISMVMNEVLPDCSQKKYYTKEATQHKLALSAGLSSRSTFTRRLAQFANTPFWTALQRMQQSTRMRRMSAAMGRTIRMRRSPATSPAPGKKIFHADRQFAMPNTYNCRLPIKIGRLPRIDDFLQESEWAAMFDPRTSQDNGGREAPLSVTKQFPYKGFNGLKPVDRWVWSHELHDMPAWMSHQEKLDWCGAWDESGRLARDSRGQIISAGASDVDRLVLTFYFMCGLLDARSGGLDEGSGHRRPDGLVNVGQAKVAWCCGINERSVRRANAKLAVLGLIRVAHPKPEIRISPDGRKWRRGPQRILYLPVRRFTPEEAQAEADRFAAAIRALEDSVEGARNAGFFRQALDLHSGLLRAWIGKEHRINAFHTEIALQLVRLGLQNRLVRALVPRPPD